MIEEVGGGILGGKKLKAFIPGGSSCPVLTASGMRRPDHGLRFDGQSQIMLGSGGVVVMNEDTCMVKARAPHHALLRA